MHILSALHRFAESGAGDVKALQEKSFGWALATTGSSSSAPIQTPSRFAASVIAAKPTAELHPVTPDRRRMCTGQSPDAHRTPRAFCW
jgi:hypothetical protein